MLKRIKDFSSRENQMIDWYAPVPTNSEKITDSTINEVQTLMGQFNQLVSEYPEVLEDENIVQNFERLKAYAKKHNSALLNCYSYQNTESKEINMAGQVKFLEYGIRIVPSIYLNQNMNNITISEYALTDNILLSKHQLNIKTKKGIIIDEELTITDNFFNYSYDKEIINNGFTYGTKLKTCFQ